MSHRFKFVIFLFLLLFIGAALRLWHIGSVPPGITWDEAAHGYNAYALLTTGKDEYGHFMPLTLQSFGDFKPALYTYMVIPFVATFRLSEIAVRLPNAILGVVAIGLVFLIIRRLFSTSIGLVTAFVFTFSPWHIHFSRGGWEANAAFTLILFGFYGFLKGLEKPWWWFVTAASFAASLYTYQSSRLFVPLLVVALLICYWRQIFPLKKLHIAALVLGLVLLIPFVLTIIDPLNRQRLVVQSMFSYRRSAIATQAIAQEDGMSTNSFVFQFWHSQTYEWVSTVIEKEFNYLSPSYLFITGDTSERHRSPQVAHGYWLDIPFYLIGLYVLAKQPWKHKKIIYLWLLIAPIPAVLSRDYTQALRSLQLVLAVDFLIALGLWQAFVGISKTWLKILFVVLYAGLFIYNFSFYLDSYYVHLPKRASEAWVSGYKDAVLSIKNEYKNFDQVVFTTDYNEPYIYVLFYLGINPVHFQQQAKLSRTRGVDVGEVEQIDSFHFRHINWPADRSMPNTLFVGTEDELPEKDIALDAHAHTLRTIQFGDGKTAFKIVMTDKDLK